MAGDTPLSTRDELELARRMKVIKDQELVDFIRSTVTKLDTLADRLEALANDVDPPTEEQHRA